MDPKNLPTLDPKLKETYERVMGTTLTPSAPSPVASTPPLTPIAAPTPTAPVAPLSTSPTPPPPPMPMAAPVQAAIAQPSPISFNGPQAIPTAQNRPNTFVAGSNTVPTQSRVSPILLIVAGVIFFVVYTLFWLRFFNIPLPFLP